MTGGKTKIGRVISASNITALHAADVKLKDCIVPYGITEIIIKNNKKHFMLKHFGTICALLCAKLVTKTNHNQHCSAHAERYNRTLVAGLRHYANKHNSIETHSSKHFLRV